MPWTWPPAMTLVEWVTAAWGRCARSRLFLVGTTPRNTDRWCPQDYTGFFSMSGPMSYYVVFIDGLRLPNLISVHFHVGKT